MHERERERERERGFVFNLLGRGGFWPFHYMVQSVIREYSLKW